MTTSRKRSDLNRGGKSWSFLKPLRRVGYWVKRGTERRRKEELSEKLNICQLKTLSNKKNVGGERLSHYRVKEKGQSVHAGVGREKNRQALYSWTQKKLLH